METHLLNILDETEVLFEVLALETGVTVTEITLFELG